MKKILSSPIIFISITLLLGGCSKQPERNDVFRFNTNIKESEISNLKTASADNQIKQKQDKHTSSKKDHPIVINNHFIDQYSNEVRSKVDSEDKKLTLSVEEIPIEKFIKLIYGQLLQMNYSVSDDVSKLKKNITLDISEEVTQDELYKISEKILNENSVSIEIENGNLFIKKGRGKSSQSDKFNNTFYYGLKIPDNLDENENIALYVPFTYITFNTIRNITKKYFLSKDSITEILQKQNVVIFKDKVKNLKPLIEFINTIDKPTMKNRISRLYELKTIESKAFYDRIKTILPSSGIEIANRPDQLGIIIKEIPEINSIFVVSEKKEWLNILEYWIEKLDQIDLNSTEKQIFIYKPKNRKASELKDLISELFSNVKFSRENTHPANNLLKGRNDLKKTNNKNTSSKLNTDDISVINDEERNTLIIYTTPQKYKSIESMLEKLDILPKQVLVEVTIAELTLKDSLQYGLEWYLKNNSTTFSTEGALSLGSGGLTGSLFKDSGNIKATLNAFADKQLVDILSTPKLVVLDNQSATINVGNKVPVLSSSSTTTNDDTTATKLTQSVEYIDTGIILNIKPTISSSGTLTLQIDQTVSEAQSNNTSSISSPLILDRSIKTNVVLKSSESILLGGLIRENKSNTKTKVPLLGDLPFIGNLFSSTSTSTDKTELLIIVKPVILNNIEKTKIITESLVERFKMFDKGL